ncbi:MAG TPA: phosphate signaling complex protein PhoU [Phycisphaerales bacterium]|nr:phosphate signaling complex protein PhoU [Phycisphaerales bacterium]HMP36322.1 phosphate signaling complex protein PhoU [Phycisphaerales bacterium]
MSDFDGKLAALRATLVAQGDRVLELVLRAVECYFDLDRQQAAQVIAADDLIDRVDVEIERASIPLLAMGIVDEHRIRSVLTIVKVNNELERIADLGVAIAEVVEAYPDLSERTPPTFRVMANSVVGMLRDAVRALGAGNAGLAQEVLSFDDTVSRFKEEITLHAQEQVAAGAFSVKFAFRLMAVTKSLERIADHCTNVAEQVIYLETGKIVRHLPEGWSDPTVI